MRGDAPPSLLRPSVIRRQIPKYHHSSGMADADHRVRAASNSIRANVKNHLSASTSSRHIIKDRKLISTSTGTITLTRSSTHVNQRNWPSASNLSSSDRRSKRKRRRPPGGDGFRKWTYSYRDCSYFKDKIIVISYNILGVENASKHPDLYFNVPPKYLEWGNRKELIQREIIHYNAGIVCFQEVDCFDDLAGLLKHDGYKGTYKARTGDANDGCAIFWEEDRFTLLHEEHIEFQSLGLRNNIAQFCILKMIAGHSDSNPSKDSTSSKSVLVGNIHVLFNPNRGDIKLGQVRLFLENAQKLSEEWGRIPIVLAGDLNSVPQSAIYQFMSSAKLDVLQHDRKRISGQMHAPLELKNKTSMLSTSCNYRWNDEELKLATGDERITHLQHRLNLNSAYLGVPGSFRTRDMSGEPSVTSCHSKFVGTVDYIWHTAELIPVRVLETVPVDVLRKMGGLPSKRWGSDHLALACEFALAGSGNSAD